MNTPVTIAIPFYNAQKYILSAIKSVLAQTYTNWELILIDDGSTDGSLEIARSVTDSRIRVISDGKNLKLAARLNQVTQLAKYDYIARMDADDLIPYDRIEKQVKYLDNHPEIDLVTTGIISITNDESPVYYRCSETETITHNQLLKRNTVVHPAIMARKSWYLRNKYDESLTVAQDYDLWLRASYGSDLKLAFIMDPLYYYREEGNITLRKSIRAGHNRYIMLSKYGGSKGLSAWCRVKSVIVFFLLVFGLNKILLKKRGKVNIPLEILDKYNLAIRVIKNE